jgi:ABC-type nitrate/sulfonate/bicarbonate transport system substrate-binding protein
MKTRAVLSGVFLLLLSGCGGAAPAASPPASASAAGAASASAKPPGVVGSASAKPAGSAAPSAAAKPAASAASTAAKPAASAASAAANPAASVASTAAKPAASGLIATKSGFTTVSPTAAPQWVGKERGFFAKNGLDVGLTSVQATAQMPALMANELQFTSTGATEVASINQKGGSVVMIAEGAAMPIFSLFANKKYTSVPALAGQTIGVTSLGAASDTAAHLFLRKFGVEDKVKIVGAGGSSPAIMAALSQGLIAGGILIPPVTAQAADAGFVELVNGVKLGVPLTQGSIVVTRGYLKDHPDIVKSYLRGYLGAWQYLSDPANKPEVVKVLEQYTKTEAKSSEIAYDFMLPLWQSQKVPFLTNEAIANVLEFSADQAVKGVDPKQLYDNSLLEAVSKE